MQKHYEANKMNNIYSINGIILGKSTNYIWFVILAIFKQVFVDDMKILKLILLEE